MYSLLSPPFVQVQILFPNSLALEYDESRHSHSPSIKRLHSVAAKQKPSTKSNTINPPQLNFGCFILRQKQNQVRKNSDERVNWTFWNFDEPWLSSSRIMSRCVFVSVFGVTYEKVALWPPITDAAT